MNKERIVESYESFQQINESSYWDEKGKYQEEYDRLYQELVPDQGPAETVKGELIRSVSRLYHEAYNNGNINALDCDYDYETDEEYDCRVNEFYGNFIGFIRHYVAEASDTLDKIKHHIITDNDMGNIYDELVDIVVEFCMSDNPQLEEKLEK